MISSELSAQQLALIATPPDRRVFLAGPAGTGKTTAAVARLLRMLGDGVRGDAVLVLAPQRTLLAPYAEALRKPAAPAGGEVTVLTVQGLAQRMIELFWPAIAEEAGFALPDRPPTFLTLETAQYFTARVVRPLLDEGAFDAVTLERNRLYSQVLDNLNKAAMVGFPVNEIAGRLKAAWAGESSGLRVFDEAGEAAGRFRAYCLAHNLLDFSLQYEVFVRHLWRLPLCRGYLTSRYRHLIADNIEEDTPVAHDLLADWLPHCASALLIYDREGGYRRFLGADPLSAYALRAACGEHVEFSHSFVTSPALAALGPALAEALLGRSGRPQPPAELPLALAEGAPGPADASDAARTSSELQSPRLVEGFSPAVTLRPTWETVLTFAPHRYHPEVLDWAADEIAGLVHGQGVPPGEIVVLAPFLSGALRFALENRLEALDVPAHAHRPSRSLREEPVTLCLLTLAALCHPQWRIAPSKYDVAQALTLAIGDMDLVRARLLADIVYRVADGVPQITPFVEIEPEMQERITFVLGGRYEGLRTWVAANSQGAAADGRASRSQRRAGATPFLDHFLGRLFGELLSQPGYGFHRDLTAGEVTANVIESVRKFRAVMAAAGPLDPTADETPAAAALALGKEYVQMVHDGVVAAQYMRSWRRQGLPAATGRRSAKAAVRSETPHDAVLLAPAHTFLMSNRPVAHQFWLDVGSSGWWERLNQPLTHPYVLSRQWPPGRQWGDADEFAVRQDALARLILGLVRRCRVQIHLGLSELGEGGSEQRGPLLRAVQNVLRSASFAVTRV